MDYNDFDTWKNTSPDCNFGEEAQEDSWFLFQWSCAPLPSGMAGDQMTWFNNPAMLAGFVRHRLLWVAAMDMFCDSEPDEECPVEEIIAASTVQSKERDYLREHLLHCVALADEACSAPEDEIVLKVRECLAYYNEKFNRNPYGGWDEGADLVHGIDELRKFWPQQERYEYSAEDVKWVAGECVES